MIATAYAAGELRLSQQGAAAEGSAGFDEVSEEASLAAISTTN
jgi:hypothetical protein